MDEQIINRIEASTGGRVEVDDDRTIIIRWDNGAAATLIDDKPVIHWIGLWQSQPRQGLLTKLVSTIPAILRDYGYTHITCKALPHTKPIFQNVGFETRKPKWLTEEWLQRNSSTKEDITLVHSIAHGCRMDEYAAWKRGEADEPTWRK